MIRETITDRAHGIDVSHYQEDYVYAKTWGQVDFAIAKIGEGYNSPYSSKMLGDFTDFNRIWDDGVAQLPIRGVYFYQRSGYSWEAQAVHVLEATEKLEIKPHMLWCDVEKGNNVIDKTMLADMKRIMDFWKVNAPQCTTGLYANKDILQNYILPIGEKAYGKQWIEELKAYPLWYAQYFLTGKSPNRQPLTLSTWSNWDLWQYSDKADSFEMRDGVKMRHYGSPDVNVYNGSVAEMKAWLRIGEVIPTPEPEEPPIIPPIGGTMKYEGKVKSTATAGVNVRATPGGTDIGDLSANTQITGDDLVPLSGYTWMHILTPQVGYVRADLLEYHEVVANPIPVEWPEKLVAYKGNETKDYFHA